MKYALTGDRKCEKIKENVSGEADMEKLKVVIADDEERICRLIEVLIDWENLGMEIAGVARNGVESHGDSHLRSCELVSRIRCRRRRDRRAPAPARALTAAWTLRRGDPAARRRRSTSTFTPKTA